MTSPVDPVSDLLPLSTGSAGDTVRDLQMRLRQTGFLHATTEVGVFDDATAKAVRDFQDRAGLTVTGVCDRSTWSALIESGYSLGDRLLYNRVPMLRGDDIATLQRRLSELGFHSGRVDGIFGPETELAVTTFQRNTALVTDGVAGPDVVAQLRRLGSGFGSAGETVTKADVAERLKLLAAPHELTGSRIAIAEPGTLPALVHTITSRLDTTGALTLAIHHPDGPAEAAEANRFTAQCFIGCTSRADAGARVAYYRTDGFESPGGRHLANLVARHLDSTSLPGPISTHGMRIPVLRETRMPAVWCELGPIGWVVENGSTLAIAISTALAEWIAAPLDAST